MTLKTIATVPVENTQPQLERLCAETRRTWILQQNPPNSKLAVFGKLQSTSHIYLEQGVPYAQSIDVR